jgi:hypothetical protein
MKHAVYGLLGAIACATAGAPDSVLPQDFFISGVGKLRLSTEIRVLTNDSFELRQHFEKHTSEGEALNFMTFCVASAIAVQRKFPGWSLGMQSTDDPNVTSRVVTLVLLKSQEDAKKLPTTMQWIPYQTPGQFRPTCSHIVDPKYLWAESASTIVEKGATPLSYDVGKDEPAYPTVNPHPTHQVTLTGILPPSQPIDDVEVLYFTDAQADDPSAEQCRRPSEVPDKLPPFPLKHRVVLPLNRTADSYRMDVFVDQYLPGRCRWHLQAIQFRLHMSGFADPMPIQHGISVVDPERFAKLADYARALPDHGARMELWCQNPPRYFTGTCADFGDAVHGLSPQQRDSIPAIDREDQNAAYLLPETTAVQVNFHDVGAIPRSTPTSP